MAACDYDGGDCIQLCKCWDKQELLGNGECDPICNTTNCDWDRFDCKQLDDQQYFDECNKTFVAGEHECDPKWINDGWCDNYCQNNIYCNNDGDDCLSLENACNEGENCALGIQEFRIASRVITDDNYIIPKLTSDFPISPDNANLDRVGLTVVTVTAQSTQPRLGDL